MRNENNFDTQKQTGGALDKWLMHHAKVLFHSCMQNCFTSNSINNYPVPDSEQCIVS